MNRVKDLIPYVIIIIVVLFVRTYLVTPVRVSGDSMYPTLRDKEILLLKKFERSFDFYDIVVLEYQDKKIIKRIIGMPGDHVQILDGKLYINQKEVKDSFSSITYDFNIEDLGYLKIPNDMYLVLGDNRTVSSDSRSIGLISKENIIGVADIRLFPFTEFGEVMIKEA